MNQRRNILKLLGVAGVGALVNTEATATTDTPEAAVPNLAQVGMQRQLAIASSLENMAKAIREGTLAATSLDVHSSLKPEAEWMSHTVTVNVEILKDHTS
jgi:hypothetical protein